MERYNDQLAKVVQYAREYATRKGNHQGELWLRDEFNDYFKWHEQQVEAGRLPSFGGMTGSRFNREVMAGQIELELRPNLSDLEANRLRATLDQIAKSQGISSGWVVGR